MEEKANQISIVLSSCYVPLSYWDKDDNCPGPSQYTNDEEEDVLFELVNQAYIRLRIYYCVLFKLLLFYNIHSIIGYNISIPIFVEGNLLSKVSRNSDAIFF